MTAYLAATIAGYGDPQAPERSAHTWLRESIDWLALLATHRTYRADPGLWRLGEEGRARTVEDFTHHLRAVLGGDAHWHKHLDYTVRLFDMRGFPHRWLFDAFVTLRDVLGETFPTAAVEKVDARLAAAPTMLADIAAAADIDLSRPTAYDAPLT